MITQTEADAMVSAVSRAAVNELVERMKRDRSAAPVVMLVDFAGRISDANLATERLRALAEHEPDSLFVRVTDELRNRRADFVCIAVAAETAEDGPRAKAVVRVEHLLDLFLHARFEVKRKGLLSGPRIVGDFERLPAEGLLWSDEDRRVYVEEGRAFIGQPSHAREDYYALHDSLLTTACSHIDKSGEFFPFGETVDRAGALKTMMVVDDEADSSGLIDLIASVQRSERDEIRAAGIASEVYLRSAESAEPTPAIVIDVDLASGPSFRTITPWERGADGVVRFGETAPSPEVPRVWT